MKLRLTFVGFTGLDAGATEFELEPAGDTLESLLVAVDEALGADVLRALCHEGHKLDSGVLLLCNDARVDGRNLEQCFADGDRISFVRMVAGG